MASAAAGVAAAIAGAGTGPTPPMFVSLRGKESLAVELHDPTTGTFGTAVADLGEVLEFQYSSDGSTMAVLKKDRVLLFKLVPGTGVPELLSELPEDNVTALAFSPLGSRLLTLRKRKPGEEAPNLRVWDVASGKQVIELFSKASAGSEEWPPLQWTGDEKFAARMTGEGLVLLHGDSLGPVEGAGRIPAAQRFWISPAKPAAGKRAVVVTFIPRTKSKPAAVSMWTLPPTPAPVASKSLQSDACRVVFNCDGTAALAELSTASSASSYYGDSRLFLFTADGKVSAAVPQAKEGAVADFAWNPTDPGQFIVIAGRSPPAATLHTLPKGDAVFSFGTGSFNTVKYQPQGRAVALGGFGNMGGDVQVWDVKKCKPVSAVWNTPVATHFSWGPDGRTFLAATTRPRLNVDNGYRLYTYKGALLRHVPLETLFDAQWRPAPLAVFPDRAVSPLARGAAAAAPAAGAGGAGATTGASAAAAPTPAAPPARAGAYVPPHLRGAAAGASSVTAMMKEGHKKAERLVGPGAASTAPKALLVPGMAADGDAKKKRRRKKKAAGAGGAAAGAGGDDDGDEEGDD